MEKLIELLNEYHHFNSDLIYYGWDEECEKFYFHTELPEEQKKKLGDALSNDGIDEQRVGNEWICSKKFGFIKWLVENEKIDKSKVFSFIDTADTYEDILCLLALSDEPIEDLISFLK